MANAPRDQAQIAHLTFTSSNSRIAQRLPVAPHLRPDPLASFDGEVRPGRMSWFDRWRDCGVKPWRDHALHKSGIGRHWRRRWWPAELGERFIVEGEA